MVKNTTKTKETIEHIKDDAKQYYHWKSMWFRYFVIFFLFVLLILQFLLPKNNTTTDPNVEDQVDSVNSWEIAKNNEFTFFDTIISPDEQQYLDKQVAEILSNKNALLVLYKKSLSVLPNIENNLKEKKLHTDFKYLSLLNWLELPIWSLWEDLAEDYDLIVDDEIDERLNTDKFTKIVVNYMQDIYEAFWSYQMTMAWYLVWLDQLEEIVSDQQQSKFEDLYFKSSVMDMYYKTIAYKYIFENIDQYFSDDLLNPYYQPEVQVIEVWQIKDLNKYTKKEWYTFKEIKELNPWILWDSLPKGNRNIKVYSK